MRAIMKPRYWHIPVCSIVGAGIFSLADFACLRNCGELSGLKEIWALAVLVPMLCGAAVTLGAGGAALGSRVIGAAICGGLIAVLYMGISSILGGAEMSEIAAGGLWRVFLFTILSAFGVLLTEIWLPEPGGR